MLTARTPLLLVAVLLLLSASHGPSVTLVTGKKSGGGGGIGGLFQRKAAEPVVLPVMERVIAQHFEVSVTTATHGTFNATLRIQGSINFPDRMHGELVPHGSPTLQSGQTALGHFARDRDLTDDKFAPVVVVPTDKKGRKIKSKGPSAATGVERPTLLVMDIKLHHANSPRGTVAVHALPAATEAMVDARESLEQGTAVPAVTANFLFRPDRVLVFGTRLSDFPMLAKVASAVLSLGGGEMEAGERAADDGDFTLRLLSDHEFVLEAHIPLPGGKRERIWVYGYAAPSHRVLLREEKGQPWWYMPAMLGVGCLTSIVQVLSGINDGKAKAAERKALASLKDKAADEKDKKEN